MMILPLLLVSACIATEGQERIPSPSATSTQIMEAPEAQAVQVDAEGKYFITDRGDGCEYHETGRVPAWEYLGTAIPEEVMLWATPPAPPQCVAGWSYEPDTGKIRIVVP